MTCIYKHKTNSKFSYTVIDLDTDYFLFYEFNYVCLFMNISQDYNNAF